MHLLLRAVRITNFRSNHESNRLVRFESNIESVNAAFHFFLLDTAWKSLCNAVSDDVCMQVQSDRQALTN